MCRALVVYMVKIDRDIGPLAALININNAEYISDSNVDASVANPNKG